MFYTQASRFDLVYNIFKTVTFSKLKEGTQSYGKQGNRQRIECHIFYSVASVFARYIVFMFAIIPWLYMEHNYIVYGWIRFMSIFYVVQDSAVVGEKYYLIFI